MATTEGTSENKKSETTEEKTITDKAVEVGGIIVEGAAGLTSVLKIPAAKSIKFFQDRQPADETTIPHAALGTPPLLNSFDDPNGRAYSKFLLADTKGITFTPGVPQFFRAKTENGELIKAEDAADTLGYMGDDLAKGIASFLSTNIRTSPDFRYYGFKVATQDYSVYVNLMLTTVFAKLKTHFKEGSSLVGNLELEYEPAMWESGFTFFLDKGATVNEVISNDFGASKLEGFAKTASGVFKEMKYLLGSNGANQTMEDLSAQQNNEVKAQMADLAEGGGVLDNILSLGGIGGIDPISTVVNGSQLMFPHVWNDSTFDRNYNLTFKLSSPYGDPVNIFRNIYVPFAALLCLAAPRQDKFMGYNSPFICRIDCPGFFMTDMAVITSLAWRRGGSEDLFTKDGYPLEIEVTMTIRDLYPVFMMSNDFQVMKASNPGFSYFLDNLGGLGFDESSLLADIEGFFARKISAVLTIDEKLKNIGRENEIFRTVVQILGGKSATY